MNKEELEHILNLLILDLKNIESVRDRVRKKEDWIERINWLNRLIKKIKKLKEVN